MDFFGKFLAALFEGIVVNDNPEVEDSNFDFESSPEMVRTVSPDGEIEWAPVSEGFDSGLD